MTKDPNHLISEMLKDPQADFLTQLDNPDSRFTCEVCGEFVCYVLAGFYGYGDLDGVRIVCDSCGSRYIYMKASQSNDTKR